MLSAQKFNDLMKTELSFDKNEFVVDSDDFLSVQVFAIVQGHASFRWHWMDRSQRE